MKTIDLHVHTTASDGTLSPAQAAELAAAEGLAAIAITDHDTLRGYPEAAAAGAALGLEVVPGVEISTRYNGAVHILGYYVDPDAPALCQALDWVVQDRDERNRRVAEQMAADGLPVSYEAMQARFGPVVGRPHFARILVELGLAESVADAFARYVEKGRRYYLPRHFLSIEDSVSLIARAGGVPVLAHPFQYRMDDAMLRELIEHCMDSGLRGVECFYSGYSPEQSAYLCALAEDYGLLQTGGSDFHGANKPHIALGRGTGALRVPYELLARLRDEAGK